MYPKILRRGIGLAKLREMSSNKVLILFLLFLVTSLSIGANIASGPTTTSIAITPYSSTKNATGDGENLVLVDMLRAPPLLHFQKPTNCLCEAMIPSGYVGLTYSGVED